MKHVLPFMLLLFLAGFFRANSSNIATQEDHEPYVRLATLWDSPGSIQQISPDGRLLVTRDKTTEITRLVEVASGHVRGEWPYLNYIAFSPNGRFLAVPGREPGTSQIMETATGNIIADIVGGASYFSRDSRLLLNLSYDATTELTTTRVVELDTGNILREFSGRGDEISPDNSLVTLVDTQSLVTRVIEIATGNIVFELPAINYVQRNTSISTGFSPDGNTLAIFQMHNNTAYIYDIDSWEMRFSITGYVTFSPDGRSLIAYESDGFSKVQHVNAVTGEVLDEIMGDMWFSSDGKYLFRSEAITYESRDVQVIDVSTNQMITEQTGYIAASLSANNTMLQVFDNETDSTRYIEITTGQMIREIQGYSTLSAYDNDLLLVNAWSAPIHRLMSFESGIIYATERDIKFSPAGEYVFASNGLLVDVYGPASARVDTMPVPRPNGGIASASRGEIVIHSAPDAPDSITERNLNTYYFYVMGQNFEHTWLYVTYYHTSTEIRRIEGWIRSDNLTVIEPWDDAPILDPADPLGSLRAIAEAQAL